MPSFSITALSGAKYTPDFAPTVFPRDCSILSGHSFETPIQGGGLLGYFLPVELLSGGPAGIPGHFLVVLTFKTLYDGIGNRLRGTGCDNVSCFSVLSHFTQTANIRRYNRHSRGVRHARIAALRCAAVGLNQYIDNRKICYDVLDRHATDIRPQIVGLITAGKFFFPTLLIAYEHRTGDKEERIRHPLFD